MLAVTGFLLPFILLCILLFYLLQSVRAQKNIASQRRVQCGQCDGCKRKDCGSCVHCHNAKKYIPKCITVYKLWYQYTCYTHLHVYNYSISTHVIPLSILFAWCCIDKKKFSGQGKNKQCCMHSKCTHLTYGVSCSTTMIELKSKSELSELPGQGCKVSREKTSLM